VHTIQNIIDVQSRVMPERGMTAEELSQLVETTADVCPDTPINGKYAEILFPIDFIAR